MDKARIGVDVLLKIDYINPPANTEEEHRRNQQQLEMNKLAFEWQEHIASIMKKLIKPINELTL